MVPTPVALTVLPLIVAGPLLTLKVTGNPLLAVAARRKGGPRRSVASESGEVQVTVWGVCAFAVPAAKRTMDRDWRGSKNRLGRFIRNAGLLPIDTPGVEEKNQARGAKCEVRSAYRIR